MVVCFLSPNLWIGPSFLHILHTLIPCSFCTSSYFAVFYIIAIRNHWFKAYLYLYDTTLHDTKVFELIAEQEFFLMGNICVSCDKIPALWLVVLLCRVIKMSNDWCCPFWFDDRSSLNLISIYLFAGLTHLLQPDERWLPLHAGQAVWRQIRHRRQGHSMRSTQRHFQTLVAVES